ncbi:MAG TPA: hypothetical protein VJA40_06035 [archaeon]|nr:hypothetical protein [archaeon]
MPKPARNPKRQAKPRSAPDLFRMTFNNTDYHDALSEALHRTQGNLPKTERERFLEQRRQHFQQLKQDPRLKAFLESSGKVRVKTPGGTEPWTILRNGFQLRERPVVVALDPFGRSVLFYKSTGINSKKPGEWLPARGLGPKDLETREWFEKFPGHPDWRGFKPGPEHAHLPGHPHFHDVFTGIAKALKAREKRKGLVFKRAVDSDVSGVQDLL